MISQPWRKPANATLIMGLVFLSIINMIILFQWLLSLLKRAPLASNLDLKCKFYLHSTRVKMFRLCEASTGALRLLQIFSIQNRAFYVCPWTVLHLDKSPSKIQANKKLFCVFQIHFSLQNMGLHCMLDQIK